MEEESSTEEALHLFLGLGEGHGANGIFARLGQLPLSMSDFIAEKGYFRGSDEGLLHFQHYAIFGTSGNDSFELVGGIFVTVS